MEPLGYGDRAGHDLDAVFAALADPTRRALLERLARGEATVTELAAPLDISQPAVSKHLKVLEQAGLVSVSRDGTSRPRRLEAAPLAEASAWLERYREYWEASYARLDELLADLRRQRGS
ncbi:MAG TPA: metalloregulator ArsR/SmtB family transcription factor [Trueperaceae bacterium]|nr:metalloregulator ArsR/SmtB family transcription factor [Trueperaceae bacterium]